MVAQVEIDEERPYFVLFGGMEVDRSSWRGKDFIETRAGILKSKTLALQTIRFPDLENNPEFESTRYYHHYKYDSSLDSEEGPQEAAS